MRLTREHTSRIPPLFPAHTTYNLEKAATTATQTPTRHSDNSPAYYIDSYVYGIA